MDKTLESYKYKFLVFTLILSYTAMRFYLNGVYVEVTFEKLVGFEVIKPYAYRVLVPAVVALLKPLGSLFTLFFVIEFLMVTVLYVATFRLSKHFLSDRQAKLSAILLLVLLSLVYIINYRVPFGQPMTFFFPYDTPALVFTILGLHLSIVKKWSWLYLLMLFATLNRESSVLVAFMLPALYIGTETKWQRPCALLLLIYSFVRIVISYFLRNHQGVLAEVHNRNTGYPHLTENMYFLLHKESWMWLMVEFAYLPLFWLAVNHYIPQIFLRLRFIVLAYVLGLFLVGNIVEGRIWGEVVIILYLPVVLGCCHWLENKPSLDKTSFSCLKWAEHFAVPIIIFTAFFLAAWFFSQTAQ